MNIAITMLAASIVLVVIRLGSMLVNAAAIGGTSSSSSASESSTKAAATALAKEDEEHRMCGRTLVNTLKTVCNHSYIQPHKTQLYDNYYRTLIRGKRSSVSGHHHGHGHKNHHNHHSYYQTNVRRGITFDCCTNKCSIRYIRSNYCGTATLLDGIGFSMLE